MTDPSAAPFIAARDQISTKLQMTKELLDLFISNSPPPANVPPEKQQEMLQNMVRDVVAAHIELATLVSPLLDRMR